MKYSHCQAAGLIHNGRIWSGPLHHHLGEASYQRFIRYVRKLPAWHSPCNYTSKGKHMHKNGFSPESVEAFLEQSELAA